MGNKEPWISIDLENLELRFAVDLELWLANDMENKGLWISMDLENFEAVVCCGFRALVG